MLAEKKTERIVARISPHVYDIITKAAQISGSTINQFIAQSAYEKAQMMIKEENIIRLVLEDAEQFFDKLENPPAPNKNLKKILRLHKELT